MRHFRKHTHTVDTSGDTLETQHYIKRLEHNVQFPTSESEWPGNEKVRWGELSGDVRRYSCLRLLLSLNVRWSTLTVSTFWHTGRPRCSTGTNLVMFLRQELSCHVDVLYANGRSSVTVVMTTLPAPPGEYTIIIVIIIIIIANSQMSVKLCVVQCSIELTLRTERAHYSH